MMQKTELDARDRLVAAAAELVHTNSYVSVGVQSICEAADVKKGSFYYYFPSKQALVLTVLDKAWGEFVEFGLDPIFNNGLPPRRQVEAMYQLAFDSYEELKGVHGRVVGCPFGNLAAETSTLEEEIRERLNEIFANWAGYFERALRAAQDAGELSADMDAAHCAWGLLGCLQGALLLAKTTDDTSLISAMGREVVSRVWSGGAA